MKLMTYSNPLASTAPFYGWNSFFHSPSFGPLFRDAQRWLQTETTREDATPGKANWYEDDDNFYALVDFPGAAKDQIQLEAEDGFVRIALKKKESEAHGETTEWKLTTPDGINPDQIEAKLEDGVLTLTLPKALKKEPVKIAIS